MFSEPQESFCIPSETDETFYKVTMTKFEVKKKEIHGRRNLLEDKMDELTRKEGEAARRGEGKRGEKVPS